MSKEEGTIWEIPRCLDTEWLFESDVDEEEEVQKDSTEKVISKNRCNNDIR